jgi:hypothetical protein
MLAVPQPEHGLTRNWVRVSSALLAVCLTVGFLSLPGYADQTLQPRKGAVYVQIRTGMDVKKTLDGSAFEGVTRENYYYEKSAIPAGTYFTGHVHLIKPSRRLTRPGFVQLDLEQARFPSGHVVSLSEPSSGKSGTLLKTGIRTRKLNHPEAKTFWYVLEMGLGLSAGSAVIDIPIKIITGVSFATMLGIGTGVRIVEGIAAEYLPGERRRHNRHSDSWPHRWGHGFVRGVGAVGVYHLVKRAPNPKLGAGEMLPLRFKKQGLIALFKAAREEAIPPTASPDVIK